MYIYVLSNKLTPPDEILPTPVDVKPIIIYLRPFRKRPFRKRLPKGCMKKDQLCTVWSNKKPNLN